MDVVIHICYSQSTQVCVLKSSSTTPPHRVMERTAVRSTGRHHSRSMCAAHVRSQSTQRAFYRPIRPSVRVFASMYSQTALTAIRSAQQEACRQGSLFLAPPHLLQGLLDTQGCMACKLLEAAGMSSAAAQAVFVDPQMVPGMSSMSPGDLHWAPDARKALQIAALLADGAGKQAAGTPHLLLGLLDCGNSAVKQALSKAGVQVLDLRLKAEQASRECDEPPAASQKQGDEQAAQLVQQYKQWAAQDRSTPFTAGPRQDQMQPTARTAEDDDIYE